MKLWDFKGLQELIQIGRQYQASQQRLSDAERQNNAFEREAAMSELASLKDDHARLEGVFTEIDLALQAAEDKGDKTEAVTYLARKAGLLAQLDRQPEAIVLFDQALAHLDPSEEGELDREIRIRRALVKAEIGQLQDAETDLEALLQTEDRPASRVRLLGHKGDLYLATGNSEQAQSAFEAALNLAEGDAIASERLRLLRGLAQAFFGQSQIEQAIDQLRTAMELAHAAKDPEQEWQVVLDLIDLEAAMGHTESVLALSHQARRLAESRGDHRHAAIQRENAVRALLSLDRHKEALVLLHESLDYVRRRGPRMKKLVLLMQLGQMNYELGRFEESESAYQEALEESEFQNNPRTMAVALGRLGALYAEQGDLDVAIRYGELALDKVEEEQEPEIVAEQQVLLALTYRDLGDHARAATACTKAIELFDHLGQEQMAARARQLMSEMEVVA